MVQEQINAPGGKNDALDEAVEAAQVQINLSLIHISEPTRLL